MSSKGVKRKPLAVNREKCGVYREHEYEGCNNLWICRNILWKSALNERCKQSAASTQLTNQFKWGVTNTDSDVKKELECHPNVSEVLDDIHTY